MREKIIAEELGCDNGAGEKASLRERVNQ